MTGITIETIFANARYAGIRPGGTAVEPPSVHQEVWWGRPGLAGQHREALEARMLLVGERP